MAIQLARGLYGATFVATTASKKKEDIVLALGADYVANYKDPNCVAGLEEMEKFDVILDTVGDLKRFLHLGISPNSPQNA